MYHVNHIKKETICAFYARFCKAFKIINIFFYHCITYYNIIVLLFCLSIFPLYSIGLLIKLSYLLQKDLQKKIFFNFDILYVSEFESEILRDITIDDELTYTLNHDE